MNIERSQQVQYKIPTVLASNLTFDYLNDTEHTVDDLWDGWLNTQLNKL